MKVNREKIVIKFWKYNFELNWHKDTIKLSVKLTKAGNLATLIESLYLIEVILSLKQM